MGHYISWDNLFTSQPIEWKRFDNAVDAASILHEIRNSLFKISHLEIESIFGPGRNGIRDRALRVATSDHYVLKSLKRAGPVYYRI